MAWDEWEELKEEAARKHAVHMELNQTDGGGGYTAQPSQYGDLKATQGDLAKIGSHAFTLYNDLWQKGRKAVPSSEKAAGVLTKKSFLLGEGLQHVADRWDEQLSSLRDACAHISNHMSVTKKIHANDDHFINRQMSSIDALDTGFDERVGKPGDKNPVYYPEEGKKHKKGAH